MTRDLLKSFFDELEKIAAGFQGGMLKSPIAKQLVKERLNWRAARGALAQPLRTPSSVPGSPSPVLAAARAARPAPVAARQFATPEQAMLAKLQAGMKKPSGAAQAAAAERVAATGRGFGKTIARAE